MHAGVGVRVECPRKGFLWRLEALGRRRKLQRGLQHRPTMLQIRPNPSAAAVHHERASLCKVSVFICVHLWLD